MSKIKFDMKTAILLGLFVTVLILGNLLGSKVISIFGILTSVGIFAYPVSFLITDIVEEVHGKKVTTIFVYVAFVSLIVTLLYVFFSYHFPPASIYENNEAYKTIFANSLRVVVASLTAFLLSQFHDIWAFNFWKEKTKGKYLWLRNTLSTSGSQLIDSVVFMFIAFYQVTPGFTFSKIVFMVIPYWLIKIGFAIADTPLVYLGVRWLRK